MTSSMPQLFALMALLGTAVVPAPAQALETTKLWLERNAGSMPLAQVPDFRLLAQQVVPAVVSIQVEQRVRGRGMGGQGPGMPQDPFDFFHRYFGGEMPREYRNRGLGSGFIIDADGLILTNNHVIEDADTIEVTVSQADGSERKLLAKVMGTAPEYDVALIKTTEPLGGSTIAYLGDSDTTQIGDWVMAVGNPFGLSHSVSVGIISAKERRDVAPSGRHGLYNFLQTDASINPGNSGGPLVNMRGEVIGINSAINASGAGIGFAIPINMVKSMLHDLKTKGRFVRAWLGVTLQPLTPELAKSFGLKSTQGALVGEVVSRGPADQADIREGDVIVEFNRQPLRASSDLPLFVSMAGVGKRADVKLIRGGQERVVTVVLEAFPEGDQPMASAQRNDAKELGAVLGEITPPIRQQLGLDENLKGVIIQEIDETGLAARLGLRPLDILLSLNGKAVTSPRQAIDEVRRARSGSIIRLKVQRGRGRLFLAATKP
jgi:serine protease Do